MRVRRDVPWPVDPVAVARRLAAAPAWCWLDGSSGENAAARSYLGVASEVRLAERGREREFLESLRSAADDAREGWVVALGYELGVALLGLDPAPDDAEPAFALGLDIVLVLDHDARSAELRGPSDAALDEWWRGYGEGADPPPKRNAAVPIARPRAADWRRSAAEYEVEVEACRASIRDGEAYVLCLTDTAETRIPNGPDPLALYERLSGSARGAVIVAGSRALVSASPERFLSVRGDRVATHPIKGTRPRGAESDTDARLAAELAADPKERAENLMIVDLMRNDLSRVCLPGSVRTTGFLRVETHPHVHQLVSTVEGVLTSGRDAIDAILACFPGGSMTGAPKRRAVEILAQLEGASRGLYSGCFGWVGAGAREQADTELAMTIRSIELRGLGDGIVSARVGAGGGITIDSDPAREQGEKLLKAAPLLAAVHAST